MALTAADVGRLAELARISLTAEELEHLAPQLEVILESVAQVAQVAGADVPPTSHALPLVNVNEIYNLDLSRTNVVDGQEVILVRDKALPLFWLKRWLMPGASEEIDRTAASVVIVSVGTQRVGFVVDQLVGQEEVVIKPLGGMLQGTPGMAGATITGDGRIALILDIPGLLKRYARKG